MSVNRRRQPNEGAAMAERTQGETTIAAEPRAIMVVIADFEAYPEWASGVKKSEVQERDAEGRGQKVRFEVSMLGLSGSNGSTKVVYRASVEPGIPMMGFMKRKMESQVIDIALKGLKKRVESR